MFLGNALAGYLIAQPSTLPGGPQVYLHGTFGATPTEAWARHLAPGNNTGPDRGILIQRWMDRGYRLVKARLEIVKET